MQDVQKAAKVSFEEFKLYYETTERVTDRRLETNRWNYSVCLAMLVGIAVSARWSLIGLTSFIPGVIAVGLLSAMAIIFCRHWLAQIEDFKSLNNAKFAVLAQMAPDIVFESEHHKDIQSFLPFDKEWKRLENIKALTKPKELNLVALKSSGIEYFIPKAYMFIFSMLILCDALLIIYVGVRGFSVLDLLNKSVEQMTK